MVNNERRQILLCSKSRMLISHDRLPTYVTYNQPVTAHSQTRKMSLLGSREHAYTYG